MVVTSAFTSHFFIPASASFTITSIFVFVKVCEVFFKHTSQKWKLIDTNNIDLLQFSSRDKFRVCEKKTSLLVRWSNDIYDIFELGGPEKDMTASEFAEWLFIQCFQVDKFARDK